MRRAHPTGLLALLLLAGAAPAAEPSPGASSTSEIQRTLALSPDEKLAYAREAVQEIADAVADVEVMLAKARSSNDGATVDALIPRSAALKALKSAAEGALPDLEEAVAAGDGARIDHLFRTFTVAVTNSRRLLAEAQRQSADQDHASGNTSLEWQDQLVSNDGQDETTEMSSGDVSIDIPQNSAFE